MKLQTMIRLGTLITLKEMPRSCWNQEAKQDYNCPNTMNAKKSSKEKISNPSNIQSCMNWKYKKTVIHKI